MKQLILVTIAVTLITACGGSVNNNAVNNANTKSTNTVANVAPNTAANTNAAATANTTTNAAANKPVETGPRRIEFKKGEFSGTEDVTLAAGATATFVVGAGDDQKLYIESYDNSFKIKITGGKVAELSNENGTFDGITLAKGDVRFTLTNPGKTEIKTKLTVTLVDNGD